MHCIISFIVIFAVYICIIYVILKVNYPSIHPSIHPSILFIITRILVKFNIFNFILITTIMCFLQHFIHHWEHSLRMQGLRFVSLDKLLIKFCFYNLVIIVKYFGDVDCRFCRRRPVRSLWPQWSLLSTGHG